MSPVISVEIDKDAAKLILGMLMKEPMPPLDEEDRARYVLRGAIERALEECDA